jgi:uncharacterized protein YdaT
MPKFPMSDEEFAEHMKQVKETSEQEYKIKQEKDAAEKAQIVSELKQKQAEALAKEEEIKLLTKGCRQLYKSL